MFCRNYNKGLASLAKGCDFSSHYIWPCGHFPKCVSYSFWRSWMSEHLAITARQEPSSGSCLSGHALFLLCEREALASPPMNWRGWQPLSSAPFLHGLTAPCGLQGSVATYSLQSVVNQGLGVGMWAGEWLMLRINPASVHTSLSLYPEAQDSLLVFFLPVSIITTHLWKLMSHLNGEDDEVKRHGNTALIHILNIIKTHMEMHLRKHAVSVIVFPMRQPRA